MFKTKTQIPKNLNSLELMRQNNFRIFKERSNSQGVRTKPQMHRTAMHVWLRA
jgi:hypothetical protein